MSVTIQLRTVALAQSPQRKLALRGRARRMRHHPTLSEQALWARLRRKQLIGVQFRRQVVLGGYIVDFLASSIHLVFEVDGGYHGKHARLDARRQARLQRAGYEVLRLTDELVLRQPEVAVARVVEVMRRLLASP